MASPEGFVYRPAVVTQEMSDLILQHLDAGDQWRSITVSADSRQVIHYGFEYKYDRSGLVPTQPMPDILVKAARNIQSKLEMPPISFDQHIANRYAAGQGISPHVDHPGLFGDIVMCATLGSGAELELTKGGQVFRQYVEPLSVYVLTLDSRYIWKHAIRARASDVVNGIRKLRNTRISLTWRVTRREGEKALQPVLEKWVEQLRRLPPRKPPSVTEDELDELVSELGL